MSEATHAKHAEEQGEADGQGQSEGPGQSTVEIIVNGTGYRIHRGRRTVAEIKAAAGVPAAHELELIKSDTDLDPLADDASLVIKGGERFLSHPKDSGSS